MQVAGALVPVLLAWLFGSPRPAAEVACHCHCEAAASPARSPSSAGAGCAYVTYGAVLGLGFLAGRAAPRWPARAGGGRGNDDAATVVTYSGATIVVDGGRPTTPPSLLATGAPTTPIPLGAVPWRA